MCRKFLAAMLITLGCFQAADAFAQTPSRLPTASPAAVGMEPSRLGEIGRLVKQAISEEKMPGCVICVGRGGRVFYHEAFGLKKVGPNPELMRLDTLFDLASLTKPIATATSVMHLVEQGVVRLDAPVATYLPDFGVHGKEEITILDMLVHQSGLIPDNPLDDYVNGPDVAWKNICNLGLVAPVRSAFKYSDVNFIVLGKLVEQVADKDLDRYAREHIFAPLGMNETGYLPDETLAQRAAPTEKREGRWMRGEVHDPRAYEMGGIAGHAGLFSTASDLAVYAQMMLGNGTLKSAGGTLQVLLPQSVETMTRAYPVSRGTRGLGWDKQSPYSSNRGTQLSTAAFGHGGFTGTVLWIDPELDLFFIFLSNRVHPNGRGSVNQLAGQIADIIASARVAGK